MAEYVGDLDFPSNYPWRIVFSHDHGFFVAKLEEHGDDPDLYLITQDRHVLYKTKIWEIQQPWQDEIKKIWEHIKNN